jgi:hypothetical protein
VFSDLFFHPLEGLNEAEQAAANVRQFQGDGTPYLKVPGLERVTSIRVGAQEIPLEIEQRFPKDGTLRELATVSTPLISLQTGPDGVPVLLRSKQSNDGVWQNAPVYVAGDWTTDSE